MYGGGFSMPAQPAAPRSSVAQQLVPPAAFPAGVGTYPSMPVAEMPPANPAAVPAQPRMEQADVPASDRGLSVRRYEEMQQQGLEPAAPKRGRKRKGDEEAAAAEAAWAAYYQQLQADDPELYQQLRQLEDAAEGPAATSTAAAAAGAGAGAGAEQWPPPRPLRRPLLRDGNQLREGREVLSTYHQELEETQLWRHALYGQQQRLAQEEVQAAKDRYQRNAALLGEVLGGPLLQHVAAAARCVAGEEAAGSASGAAAGAAGRDETTQVAAAVSTKQQQVQRRPAPKQGQAGGGVPVEGGQLAQPPVNGFLGRDQQQQGGVDLEQAAGNGSVQGQGPGGTAAAAGSSPLAALPATAMSAAVGYAEVAALQLLQQLAEADAGLRAAVQQFAANHAGLLPPAEQQGQEPAAAAAQAGDLQQAVDSGQQAPQQQQREQQEQQQQQHDGRPPGDPPDLAAPTGTSSLDHNTPATADLELSAAQQQQQQQQQRMQAEAAAVASMSVEAAALRSLVQLVAPEPDWFEQLVAAATPEQQVWLGSAG